jgi:hypothetical protein
VPGIVGLITKKPKADAERELLKMTQSLLHESFYVSGTWSDESLGVYVGWSAQKGSFADEMPVFNEFSRGWNGGPIGREWARIQFRPSVLLSAFS